MILGEHYTEKYDLGEPYVGEWVVLRKLTASVFAISETDPMRPLKIIVSSIADWSITEKSGKTAAITIENVQKLPVDFINQIVVFNAELQNIPKAS